MKENGALHVTGGNVQSKPSEQLRAKLYRSALLKFLAETIMVISLPVLLSGLLFVVPGLISGLTKTGDFFMGAGFLGAGLLMLLTAAILRIIANR